MIEQVRHPIFARLWERIMAPMSERRGANKHRRKLLDGLTGRVLEVGAGQGTNCTYYPTSVEQLVAIEPEDYLRQRAQQAATSVPVSITLLGGVAEKLPGEDGSFDAGVVTLVLCSVYDQDRTLAELFRVIKPGGELRFYEHVIGGGSLRASFLRFADATFWPRVFGGCRPTYDTGAAIKRAGFAVESCEHFNFRPVPLPPALPHILGVARRPV
jgi:ubiquinone/menaquinone biosynthesis C-methylase UbiE